MQRVARFSYLAIVALAASCTAGGQQNSMNGRSAEVRSELARNLERLLTDYTGEDRPAACVLVRHGGVARFENCFGMAHIERGIRADPQTNFRLASVTKQLTATAIIQLVEAGKLRYEDNLTQIFPGFPDYGRHVTVENLLTHTSGLIDYESLLPEDQTEQVKDADVLRLMLAQDSTYFEPGTEFRYSNSGYAMLAMIVERLSGERFADFLANQIFAPLQMTHTVAHEEGISTVYKRAYGYSRTESGWELTDQSPTSAVLGDGGVYSSLEDLGRWMKVVEGRKILIQPASLARALEPMRLSNGETTEYGFGWYIDEFEGYKRYHHSGSTRGFRNNVQHLPDLDLTVVFLSNRNEIEPALADSILEATLHAVSMVPDREATDRAASGHGAERGAP